jgi:hypothetical protein
MSAYVESDHGLMIPPTFDRGELRESVRADLTIALLEATIVDLRVQLQEQGWLRLGDDGQEFGRDDLGTIVAWARAAYLKNPIIRRGVEIAALYVFGQDLSVNATDKTVEAAVDRFWDDNAATFTGQQASRLLEVELEVTGNVFLALFANAITGQVLVRTVPMEEIKGIVCNPEDRADIWFYERRWKEQPLGGQATEQRAYYPDWRHKPDQRPASIATTSGTVEIRWDAPICHVKAGAFPHWRWGVPEVYAALDWATAYKKLLEDDATRSRSLAKFAWQVTTKGGNRAVQSIKTKLGTTVTSDTGETNPAPVAGATALMGDGNDLKAISIANAILPVDHSRPARQMAAAALGIPDHFFDANQSNLATSTTLDRPTELRFNERREMWLDVLNAIVDYVIATDLVATRGLINKSIAEADRTVDLTWPSLLESDINARINAIVAAATLAGSQDAGTLPAQLTSRLLMTELGVGDIDAELADLEAQQAEKDKKAAAIAKQTATNPPPVPPAQQQVDPNAPPVKAAEAKKPKASEELAGALTFFDSKAAEKVDPALKGMLSATAAD